MEGIILIIAAIILFIAFIALLIAADEVNGQKREVARNQQTVEKDLDEAEKVLFIAAILSLSGSIIAIVVALIGHSGKRGESDPRRELYYKKSSIRFWIFIAFLSPAVAGFLAFEARRRTEISSISEKRQKNISNRINIGLFTSWSGALLVLVAFVLTFTGSSSTMLNKELAEEEAEELKSREEASRQITPITQVAGWTSSRPAVREPMQMHHLMHPQPITVTQEGKLGFSQIPTGPRLIQPGMVPIQPVETFTQFTEVSGIVRPTTRPDLPRSIQPVSQPAPAVTGPSTIRAGQPSQFIPARTLSSSNISRLAGSQPAPSITTEGVLPSIITRQTVG